MAAAAMEHTLEPSIIALHFQKVEEFLRKTRSSSIVANSLIRTRFV